MNHLAGLVDGLIRAEQDAVIALHRHRALDRVAAKARARLDHKGLLSVDPLRDAEADLGGAAPRRLAGIERQGFAPGLRLERHADLGPFQGAPSAVAHQHAQGGLAAGHEAVLPEQDGLVLAEPLRQVVNVEGRDD